MSKQNTLRVTEFKGLNKATNPHNIDDRELVTLENLFVTKNRGLESRKGYRRLGDIDSGYYIKGLFATSWSSTDDRLYYVGNGYLGKMGADGTSTLIPGFSDAWGKTTQFDRYKDKVMFLNESSYLRWFNSDEEVSLVKYPELQADPDSYGNTMTNAAGGHLEVDQHYQYCISLVLGDDYLDGESMASKPSEPYIIYVGSGLPFTIQSAHPYAKTEYADGDPANDKLTIVGTAVGFTGKLNGYNAGRVNLYRRRSTRPASSPERFLTDLTDWKLVDTGSITLNSGTYSFTSSIYGFITNITGTLSDDDIELYISFSDTGAYATAGDNADVVENGITQYPWEEGDVVQVRASHMARLYNRVFLANIVGTGQARDTKKVYFSYRGWVEAINEFEIPYVGIADPMLIFPVHNYFYCDAEDVEDPITAITSFRDSIIVFTERCMFLWREGMGDPIKISNDIGCISKRTVVEFEGKLIWLAHSGIFVYDGSSVKNITFAKMQPYIDDLAKPYARSCTACVFDRKYFIAGPFEGGTQADMMLVYDFDIEAWHVRKYHISTDEKCYIDMLYTDRDGADEQLWAGLKDPDANVIIAELETGYLDQQNPGGAETVLGINCAIKTKYYSFKAPDIEKSYRNLLLDAENYYGDIDLDIYIDDLVTPKLSFSHTGSVDGFMLGTSVLGVDAMETLSDELLRLSLERGLVGSRVQFAAELVANTSPLYIHMIGFDWTPRRKLKRRYGA